MAPRQRLHNGVQRGKALFPNGMALRFRLLRRGVARRGLVVQGMSASHLMLQTGVAYLITGRDLVHRSGRTVTVRHGNPARQEPGLLGQRSRNKHLWRWPYFALDVRNLPTCTSVQAMVARPATSSLCTAQPGATSIFR